MTQLAARTPPPPAVVRTHPWTALVPPGTPILDLASLDLASLDLASLDPARLDLAGAPVLLLDGRFGGRARLRSAARRAGLRVEHEYLLLGRRRPPERTDPDPDAAASPAAPVPPDAPLLIVEDTEAAVRWLRDTVLTVPPGVTLLAPAADLALAVLRHLLPWWTLGRLVPGRAGIARAVIARAPGPPASPLTRPGREPASVVLATSRDVNAKLLVLELPTSAAGTASVVKVPTTAVAERAVAAERAMLVGLHQTGASIVAGTVPCVLGTALVDQLTALRTTALPGVPMQTGYHRWYRSARPAAVREDFALAGGWLAELQRQTAGELVPVRLLADSLDGLARRWPGDPTVSTVRDRLTPVADRLAAVFAPTCAVHGDYWQGNVLVDGGAVTGVVDWECGVLRGDPTRDVARFPLSYALYLDRHTRPGRRVLGHPGLVADGWGAGVRHALGGRGWFAHLVEGFVSSALVRLGIPARAGRAVLLGGIAELAARTDHPGFARQHLDLLHRLLQTERIERW